LIEICDVNLYVNAIDLNNLSRTIMTIVPGSSMLTVALPYFYIVCKLAQQHYFLYGWASLVDFELYATIASFGAG